MSTHRHTVSYVGLFREPGYPYVSEEVTTLLDAALRTVENHEDPGEVALDIANVLERVVHLIRDVGADEILHAHPVPSGAGQPNPPESPHGAAA